MNRDLLTIISQMSPQFSKGQRLIANYIVNHFDKAAFMTAFKLGTTVGVSESTVVRFASEVGFSGYPELQKALQELIRNKLTTVQRMDVTSDQLENGNVLARVLGRRSAAPLRKPVSGILRAQLTRSALPKQFISLACAPPRRWQPS